MKPDQSTSAKPALEIFQALSPEERDTILRLATIRKLRRGELLVRQGDVAETVYYVLRGKFDVLRDGNHLVAEIGAGEPVGEIAFFGGLTRTANVRASRDSDVLELTKDVYAQISASVPALTTAILRSFGRRLAAATASAPILEPKIPDTIGLCAAADTPIPPQFIRDLAKALQDLGRPIAILGAGDLPSGLEGADDASIAAWLAERERNDKRLLLLTGEGNDRWDRAALQQCDQLLLMADARIAQNGPVPLGALETWALPLFRPRQTALVIWRDHLAQPIHASANWMAARPAHLHHHIALDHAPDVARLARFLTGNALGAVFGGGGALGTGHIGALRALRSAGMRFDIFGGTSIGSSVAIAAANGDSPENMLAMFDRFFLREKALGRMTVPLYGVFDHHHLDARLRAVHGDSRLEDLPLNVFTVAANLSTNELQISRSGPSWQGLRTSASIPGALPPFITDTGEVLVDGGIMNNVPISVMRGLKTGRNMIFMLSPGDEWRVKARYDSLPSRAKLLWRLLTRRHNGGDFPKVGEVVARSMQVTSGRSFRGSGIGEDILLEPPTVPGMGLFSWRLGQAQEQASYEYTMRMIDALGGPEGLLEWQQD